MFSPFSIEKGLHLSIKLEMIPFTAKVHEKVLIE